MRRTLLTKIVLVFATLALVLGVRAGTTLACNNAQSCSTDYQVNEAFFGNGYQGNGGCPSSATYEACESALGETGVGNTKGTAYQAQAGFSTERAPSLTFIVNPVNTNLGVLSTTSAATTTATFSVETYLAHGYQIVTESAPPQNGSYTMQTPGSPQASSPGTEQFGINLVANSGVTGSANASCATSGFCNLGSLTYNSNYNQTGKYYYHQGDTLVSSGSSSGTTNFTITYLFNVSNLTPGGTYTFNQVLVATSTF